MPSEKRLSSEMAMSEISESGRKRNSERTVRSDGEGAAAGASRRTGGTLALHFLYGRAARFLSALDALLERFAKRGRNLFVLGLGKIPFDAESLLWLNRPESTFGNDRET